MSRLKQPEDCVVFNQTVITCITPPQSWDVIQEIRQKNLELRIFAYRPSDNRLSRNSFKFEYLEHVQAIPQNKHSFYGPAGTSKSPKNYSSKILNLFFFGISGPQCGFCYMQQYNQNTVELSLAKPGVQRRKHDNEGRNEVPDDLINELQNKSPPRATSTTETATSTITTTRTEILQTRSPEREFGTPTGSSSSISRISSPEIIKLEPITVTSLEPCEYTSKPLFEIVMSPQDVIDLSTSPPNTREISYYMWVIAEIGRLTRDQNHEKKSGLNYS